MTLLFGAEEGRDGDDDLSREPAGELGDGPFDTVLADQTESARQVPQLGGEGCNPRREAGARQ